MKQIEVVLVLGSADLVNRENSKFLVVPQDDGGFALPVTEVGEQESTHDAAARLLRELTGLDAEWVTFYQGKLVEHTYEFVATSFEDDGDSFYDCVSSIRKKIAVPYTGVVPADVFDLPEGVNVRWVKINEVVDGRFVEDHKGILINESVIG